MSLSSQLLFRIQNRFGNTGRKALKKFRFIRKILCCSNNLCWDFHTEELLLTFDIMQWHAWQESLCSFPAGTLSLSLETVLVTNTLICSFRWETGNTCTMGMRRLAYSYRQFLKVEQGEATQDSNFSCTHTCSAGKEKTLPSHLTAQLLSILSTAQYYLQPH